MKQIIDKQEVKHFIHGNEVIDRTEIPSAFPEQFAGISLQRFLEKNEAKLSKYLVSNKYYYVVASLQSLLSTQGE